MKPQVRLPILLALMAALLSALVLAACGGDDEDQTADRGAAEILQETFSGSQDVDSGRLTVSLETDLEGGAAAGASSLTLSGPFEASESDDELPRFDFDLTVSGPGQSIEAGAISTGDQGFLSLQGTDYELPAELFAEFRDGYAEAQEQADGSDQLTLQALGIDPSAWITDPQKAGTEDVGDTETEHITAGVDVSKLLADLREASETAGSVAGQGEQLGTDDIAAVEEQVEAAEVDLYTGTEDLRLRRLVVDLTLESGTATFTLELTELDEPQEISVPEDTRPLQELIGQFETLFGAAGAGAGDESLPDPSAGGTGGAASDGANREYLECVQAAGEDLEAVQECAQYL
jgi:hypothetical protein